MEALRRDPLGTLSRAAVRGDVVRLRFLRAEILFISHPDHIRHVLQDAHRNYSKATLAYSRTRSLLGRGLFTSDGEAWRRQRRLMQPAFQRDRLAGFAPVMAEAARALAAAWEARVDGPVFDAAPDMTRIAMEVASRALLGADVGEDVERVAVAVTEALAFLGHRLHALVELPLWLPTAENRRYQAVLATLEELVQRIIQGRRQGRRGRAAPAETSDLLSLLMEARDETGQGMSDTQLRDEVMTIFLAGHETTATTLSWALALLGQHPAVEEALGRELAAVLGGRDPALEDLERLVYTRMVLEETMRLYPPVWAMTRRALEDDRLGDYPVPAGTVVMFSPYVTQRLPGLWERPDEFVPERFEPGRMAALPRFAYFPFLGGPRQCIGNGFAMMEMQLVLGTLLQRYRVRLGSAEMPAPEAYVTLRPRGGVPVGIARRR
jgi:cytochrome P450